MQRREALAAQAMADIGRELVARGAVPGGQLDEDKEIIRRTFARFAVENVAPDGTATILYAFGPIGSGARGPGGVLNGTGIVQDGELRFQNSDGSQFAFRPVYADLEGRLTTPQGQSYRAVFKKTP